MIDSAVAVQIELWFLRLIVPVILLAAVIIIARERLRRSMLKVEVCPKCGGNEFSRIHRTRQDRILGVGMHLYRYRCKNPDCKWEGLVQSFHSSHRRSKRSLK